MENKIFISTSNMDAIAAIMKTGTIVRFDPRYVDKHVDPDTRYCCNGCFIINSVGYDELERTVKILLRSLDMEGVSCNESIGPYGQMVDRPFLIVDWNDPDII